MFRFQQFPLKELHSLKFRVMNIEDYTAFPGVWDGEALIAFLELPNAGEAWIIDGNNLWIWAIDNKGNHETHYFSLEQWELAPDIKNKALPKT